MRNEQATASNKKPKGLRTRYYDKTGIARHREWRGFRDTFYDYLCWLNNLNAMTIFVARSPIRIIRGMWQYRWMGSYLSTFAFVDRCLEGYRGPELRVGHMNMHEIIVSVTNKLLLLLNADERFGKNSLSKRVILHDATMPPLFSAGFPNLIALPIQVFPEFLICNMDQLLMPHYIDALESFGVPADLCAKNVAEAGVAAEDDYPQMGVCAITSNMACDGSIITTSLQMRRLQKPNFPAMMPMRHTEDDVHDFAEDEIRGAIKFIEDHTGEKYDWNAFYKAAAVLNAQNECELTKWDFFKAPYSPLSGVAESLYRVYSWASGNGLEKAFAKNDRKVVDIMTKCYKKKYIPFQGKTRHRAFVWSCSAAYYTDAPTWLQNCWGIQVILNMDSTMGFNMIDTTDQKKAMRDLALMSEKSTMRHHAVGGWDTVNKIWEYAANFNCDMIIFYDQIGCKGMNGIHGLMEDEARKHSFNFVWVEHDLEDNRTVSRRQIRDQVNNYMFTVLNEKPLDESLVDFDDSMAW